MFNIFVIHQSIYELLPFSNDIAHMEELPDGFDLYIDGHIHNRVEMKCHGKPFLIPGSTVLTQLKEAEQEDKGFYVYDTKTNTYSFNKINSRKFILLKINVEGKEPREIADEAEQAVEKCISGSSGKPVIRIELSGNLKEGLRNADVNINAVADRYREKAVIETSRSRISSSLSSRAVDGIRKGTLDNVSIKDYGMEIFIERLKQSNYTLNTSAATLFDMLSSDEKKEKAISNALSMLFSEH